MNSSRQISFASIDLVLILFYFVGLLWVGFRARKKSANTKEDFLLAGRTVTLPAFVATLVSTWYGGILGVGEYSYQYGLSNWVIFGLPYYIFALVFALFLAKKVRATHLTTIPEKLYQTYDLKTSLLGSLLTFLLVTPAAYVLMLGVLIQLMVGWSLTLCVLVSALVSVLFLFFGGFRAGLWANMFQFILMFLGFGLILPFAYHQFGGLEFLRLQAPAGHLTLTGGHTWPYIMVWFFIALWTLVDPSFHQRCYAAQSGRVAQRGILISILFWIFFDFMTTAAGIYSRAVLPGLSEPMFAYPLLAEKILPPVAKGLFYIGLFATIMSTLSSYTFTAAMTIGNDVAGRIWQNEKRITQWTRIGLALTLILAIVLALWLTSVVTIWYMIGTAVIPGLLVPLLASYFKPMAFPAKYGFIVMLAGWLTSTIWLVGGLIQEGRYWLSIEPMYPGLFITIVMVLLIKLEQVQKSAGLSQPSI
jgi:solute:Na+ symporter, SSS family